MMMPFCGCCRFKMYMPAKPCKYGIKIFDAIELKSKYTKKIYPPLKKFAANSNYKIKYYNS